MMQAPASHFTPRRPMARAARPARDAGSALLRAMLPLASDGMLERHATRPWASNTFTGMRHAFTFRFRGATAVAAGEALAAMLPEHEFSLPGHIVADVAVGQRARNLLGEAVLLLEIEALTVEEC